MPLKMVKGGDYNHKLPSVELLEYHYFEEKMSTIKISKTYNVSKGAVIKKLKRNGVKLRTISESWELASSNIGINDNTIDFLNGLLLGDGCIVGICGRKSAWYSHSDKNKNYLEWLRLALSELNIYSKIFPHTNGTWLLRSKSYRDLIRIRNMWYPYGKKKIPKIKLSSLSLFNWYIGDGSYSSNKVFLSSQFDINGRKEMSKQLININVKNSIYKNGIYIKKESRSAFFKYMISCNLDIPENYKYKFPKEINHAA